MAGDRSIRIFISSTFRDMYAEREELVKRVFPQLRQLCESRGVLWTEVDLRWGITEAQAERGEILPICLEEIRRCRPYFIGLLGERYGWIPHRLPAGLIEREAWLAEHTGESVTALEILHGVLRNPAMADHAYFYFRDPQWLKQLPNDAHSADYAAESEASARHLQNLKAAIRASRFPVREDYASPEVLGEFVLEDLTALINRLYPAEHPPSPLDQDAVAHGAFARRLVSLYLPCSGDMAELDRYASEGGSPTAALRGSGSGKSALLANWAARYSADHQDAIVLTHFIGATGLTGLNTVLARIVAELQRRAEIPHPLPESPDQLRADFGNWLSMAASMRSVVLVLDSLNELEDREGARELDWIPRVLPPALRLIAATSPGASQDAIVKRGWQTLEVKPLDAHQRSQLASTFLNLYGKKLDDRLLVRISGAPPCANPLYLTTLVDELRQFGEMERLEQQVDLYLAAPDPRALFRLVLERYQEDYQRGRPDLVQDAFSRSGRQIGRAHV